MALNRARIYAVIDVDDVLKKPLGKYSNLKNAFDLGDKWASLSDTRDYRVVYFASNTPIPRSRCHVFQP